MGLNLDVTTTDLGKIAAVKHNFNGTDYYHLGITALSMPIVASIGSSNNPANLDGLDVTYGENTDCSDKMTVNKQYTDVLDWFKKKDGVILYVWGLPTAGAGVLPETNITAHITEFLTDRGVTEANRNAFCTEYKTILDAAS